jgi:prepilin-type N-terminal cleavage/methylation domain-containing protein/prepilin-type processing-associated H-X9-DG protein
MLNTQSRRSARAFTLIELLVTIAVISILAAILFPVFARARENARRSACMSNLKQIGLGVMMYVQDYDERYPQFLNYVTGTTWVDTTAPYIKSTQVSYCPSTGYQNTLNGNYGANDQMFKRSDLTPNSISMAAIPAPSTIYMILDYSIYYATQSNISSAVNGGGWYYLPGAGAGGANTYCNGITAVTGMDRLSDCNNGRHFGGVNVTFADGHVKWLRSDVVRNEAIKESGSLSVASAWNPSVG